jgi:hypothetical protein
MGNRNRTLAGIATDWCRRCFPEQSRNIPERGLRVVEEAIEFCQALGVPKDKVLLAVEIVYGKPVGDPKQELGGTLMTAYIAAEILGWEPDDVCEQELRRVLSKSVEHFAKRNQDKLDAGLLVNEVI